MLSLYRYPPRLAGLFALIATASLACGAPEDRAAGTSNPPASEGTASSREAQAAKEAAEKTDYAAKLVLAKVTARRILDSNERYMAMVSGEIKNTGDRAVDRVQMTIGFLDRTNDFLFEEKFDPLAASRKEGPLKPGATRKWATAILVGEGWAPGKVDVEVKAVEFPNR